MNTDKIRGVLNLVFMILAVASVIVYFACDDHKVFINYYFCSHYEVAAYFFRTYIPWVGDTGHISAGAAYHSVASALGSAFPA